MKLIPGQIIGAFVKSNKNDYIGAEAIAEAEQKPTMPFVPFKTENNSTCMHSLRCGQAFTPIQTDLIVWTRPR